MRRRIPLLAGGICVAVVVCAALFPRKSSGQRIPVPLVVLQSAKTILEDAKNKTQLATGHGAAGALYAFDRASGTVLIYDRKSKAVRRLGALFVGDETLTVGPQGELYLSSFRNGTLQAYDSGGKRLKDFSVPQPFSVAVQSNGNMVVASPRANGLVHLYSPAGVLLKSFGEVKEFDGNGAENGFLNRGKVVTGPDNEIYYVAMYAPSPYVDEFTPQGELIREFPVEGDAVGFQVEKAKGFLRDRRGDCTGGVVVVNSAAIDPTTGHLWVALNGLSTTATLYEYSPEGTKLREYAFLFDGPSGRRNITHVKDIAVSGMTINVLSWGRLHEFNSDDVIAASGLVQSRAGGARSGLRWPTRFNSWAPPASLIPDAGCSPAQDYTCTADCPSGSNPTTVDCGSQIMTRLGIGDVVTQSTCTKKTIDPTPGSSAPGGCSQTASFCNPNNGGQPITGTISVEVNCNPVPTPTPTPTPIPTATPPPGGGGGGGTGGGGICNPGGGFLVLIDGFEVESGPCISPVLIDVNGDGFSLTDVEHGVGSFDLDADGAPDRVAWTAAGSDDAWLALDRNGDGVINSGAELFGNHTPQPDPPAGVGKNGFLALAVFDQPVNGGNGDGVIDSRDAVFNRLWLWRDANHDGVSQSSELHTLPELGVDSISLDYKLSKRTDQYGNLFRYRAKVDDAKHSRVGRWAWDVFLVQGQ